VVASGTGLADFAILDPVLDEVFAAVYHGNSWDLLGIYWANHH
jgi:hypothetical protein